MTRSVYIIGGAGTGKSTFTAQLLQGMEFGPLEDLHALRNAKALVTLRGHRLADGGMYLGCMRDEFPGTDGLDRASSPTGEAWLRDAEELPEWIVSEGSTLATRRFILALHEYTDLLLVHLRADEFIKELRFLERGSNQADSFVTATATRAQNLLNDMDKVGIPSIDVDSADECDWDQALQIVRDHIPETIPDTHITQLHSSRV